MRKLTARVVPIMLIAFVLVRVSPGQSTSPIRYFYDELGRLTKVVDHNGDSATYSYDAVGNLLSITRSTVSGPTIFGFTPQKGSAGQTVTIEGQGFGAAPSDNTVSFNGIAAAVSSATAKQLVVSVPEGAISGPLSVTVGGVTVQGGAFTVTQANLVSIAMSAPKLALPPGTSQQFTATGIYDDGTTQDLTSSVTWSSSNTGLATVSNAAGSRGLVTTGTNSGVAVTISATNGFFTSAATITLLNVVSLSITPVFSSVTVGGTIQFNAAAVLADGSTQDVTNIATWGSSDTSVASISNTTGSQGVATCIKAASFVQVNATLGSVSGFAGVTVIGRLLSLAITPANASLPLGLRQQFTATGTFDDGIPRDVTPTVTWSSSDTAVATIGNAPGSEGLATGLHMGSATITVTSGPFSASTALTVSEPAPVSLAVSPGSASVRQGGTFQFRAIGTLSDGSTKDLTTVANWDSSNTAVATIGNSPGSQGLARGVGIGTATITATSGNASGSAHVNVPSLVSISVSSTITTILLGSRWQYVATGRYDDFSTKDLTSAVAWSSSDTAVAAVSNSQGSEGRVTGVAEGTATITATLGTLSGTAPVTVSASGVFGTVVFSDGAPVPYPNIFVNQTDSQGNLLTYYGPTDEKGNYQVSGVGSGAFTVVAQDSQTGLSGSAIGQLSDPTEPANVPVQLEPSGTVSGTIRDASGAPVYNASISLFSSGVQLFSFQYYRFVSSDDQGQYEVDRVALGEVAVTATAPPPVDWVPGYVGAATGNLDADGQTIPVDVDLPPTSTIIGTVYASDRVTPAPYAYLLVENDSIGGGLADYYSDVTSVPPYESGIQADASGNYEIDAVPVGSVRVVASTNYYSTSGLVAGTLTGSNPLRLNPVLGNAFNFASGFYTLTDANGFVYDIGCDGSIVNGGSNNGFSPFSNFGAASFWVNTFHTGCLDYFHNEYARLDQAGRQLLMGPHSGGAERSFLRIQRKVFVPPAGGYVRYLDSLTNPLDAPVTINVMSFADFNYSFPPDTLVAGPATNGNTFAVLRSSTNSSSPILGFVFSGTNPPLLAIPSIATQRLIYEWSATAASSDNGRVTIQPHQTVTFMHFVIQWNNQDVAGAIAQAQALVNLTDPNELAGMSAQEKSQVVNFNVP